MVRFTTLGAIEVIAGERSVTEALDDSRLLALLAYLVRAGAPSDRVALRTLFWPALDAAAGDAELRTALATLERELGPSALHVDDRAATVAATAGIDCDATRFEEACEAGRVDEALGRFGGDFLPDLVVDDAVGVSAWIVGERARLRERAEEIRHRVAAATGTPIALGGARGRQGPHSPQAKAMTILTALGVIAALLVPVLAHFYKLRRG